MSTRIFINIKTHVYGSSNNVNTRLTTFMCIISRTRLGARRWNSAGVTWTSWTSCWRPGTRRGPASPDSRSATRSTRSSLKARLCFCGLCFLILICWYFYSKRFTWTCLLRKCILLENSLCAGRYIKRCIHLSVSSKVLNCLFYHSKTKLYIVMQSTFRNESGS